MFSNENMAPLHGLKAHVAQELRSQLPSATFGASKNRLERQNKTSQASNEFKRVNPDKSACMKCLDIAIMNLDGLNW